MHSHHFTAQGPVLVRLSARAWGDYPQVTPKTSRDDGDDLEGVTSYIRTMAADHDFRGAVRVSSKSLAAMLDRFDEGESLSRKRLISMATSLARYAMRSMGRPTPFGLFAGVTAADWQEQASVTVGLADRRASRIDASWLYAEVVKWLDQPEARRGIRLVVNNLCHLRGGRLVLPYVRIRSDRKGHRSAPIREVTVANNTFVQWIQQNLREPVLYEDVVARAISELRGATEELVGKLLLQLIKKEMLVTSVVPHRLDESTLAAIEVATGSPLSESRVRRGRDLLRSYDTADAAQAAELWHEVQRELAESYEGSRPSVKVDLHSDARITLPRAVAQEAEAYASMMWRISGRLSSYDHIRDYRSRFLDRYGPGVAVPLEDVIGTVDGVGYPAGYQNPAVVDPPAEVPAEANEAEVLYEKKRREIMAGLLLRAVTNPDRELVLTDADVRSLSYRAEDEPPRSMELFFQLLSKSVDDLNKGDFTLVSSTNVGSMTAGSTMGRFCDLLGRTSAVTDIMRANSDAECVEAEVSFLPLNPRAVNIMPTTRLSEYEIPLGTFHDTATTGTIDWRDLTVAVENDEFRLYWSKTGQRVVPRAPHMLAIDQHAPNLARLLIELGTARDKMWHPWIWSGLEALPFFPRLRYGKVVVSPAIWRPTPALRDTVGDKPTWAEAVQNWREQLGIPRRVLVLVGDKSYNLDLDDTFQVEMLRKEAARNSILLTEQLHEEGVLFGWSAGRSSEVVIPFCNIPKALDAPSRPRASASSLVRFPQDRENRSYLPGEEWLFGKVYGESGQFDMLLARHLPELLSELDGDIDKWFFIRYRDPASHLRVRLHGDPDAIARRVMPALARHARKWRNEGLVRKTTFDTYEPEYARYGNGGLMYLAEDLFCVDSISAVSQTAVKDKLLPGLPDEVLASVNYALLLESLGDWNWCAWVNQMFRRLGTHEAYRTHRAEITRLIRPGRIADCYREATGLQHVAALWADSSEARKYGSVLLHETDTTRVSRDNALLGLLHMQHNRLIGIDRDKERASYAILAGVARDHLFRSARAGGE